MKTKTSGNPLFQEARRLYELGLGVHWLHPRSKRPIGTQWASGPRKTWDELKESFAPDYNLGVRLGSASEIMDGFARVGFLAVVDVDIKSTDKRHKQEALGALRAVIGEAQCPEVRSGRGNGSRHLYCVTAQPFKTWNPAESSEMVKVHMPSKAPSKREREQLSEKEIQDGLRLSKAWEISLYSEGRQVVLPPSIHPDSGKPYFWKTPLVKIETLPLLDFGSPKEDEETEDAGAGASETIEDFKCDETLDVRWLPDLPESVRELIVEGVWRGEKITDRSAYLMPAVTGLLSAGLDRNGVLSVLTDRGTFLGQCAYDHAQTDSRRRAAQWLWNYTVKRVMRERDPVAAFSGEAIVEPVELSEDEQAKQAEEIEGEDGWKKYLDRTKQGQLRATLQNCKTIITHSCEQKNVVGRNEFANNDYYLCDTPWRSKKGEPLCDIDIVRIKVFCAEQFGVEFGDNTINQALLDIADVNRFHPVREYVLGLKWDGVPRVDTWLADYAEAEAPDEYLRAVSRRVLTAMIKRVFEPGCKFDHVLILEGEQGVGKSTLIRKLAGDAWFSDQPLVIGDKDAVLTMQAKWIIELGELASLNRSELEHAKTFITQRSDRIRAPYGKRVEEYPRQCIFIGSTNHDEYLKDDSGNRRFWPVRVGEVDFEGVAAIRDQLFAEAYQYYLKRQPLYLDSKLLNQLASAEQELRAETDEWWGAVSDIVNGEMFPREGFEMRDLAKRLDQFGAHKLDKSDQMRLAKILRSMGYARLKMRDGDRVIRKWTPIKGRVAASGANVATCGRLGGHGNSPMIADFY